MKFTSLILIALFVGPYVAQADPWPNPNQPPVYVYPQNLKQERAMRSYQDQLDTNSQLYGNVPSRQNCRNVYVGNGQWKVICQ